MSQWLPSFVQPSAAWWFALLIPIVVFYFLKLRRDRLEVSSLALWRQVISDQRVNSPFQRFKRNLLLWLQLLLLLLLVLAAMQPYWRGAGAAPTAFPILIDCSASMGARDEAGRSRLELVQAEVRRIVDELPPGQKISLISIGAAARRLTEFTDNKPVLRDALQRLQVDDVPTRLEEALRLTDALSRTQEIKQARLYTDGNLPTRPNPATGVPTAIVDADLPFVLEYFQQPSAGTNIGLTALNARRSSADRWDIFARIDAAVTGGAEADFLVTADGVEIGAERVILGPGESQRLVFPVSAERPQRIEARLKPIGHDALGSDNVAWLSLPAGRPLRVRCASELTTYHHALSSMDGLQLLDASSPASPDLLISDRRNDENSEASVALFIGLLPRDLADLLSVIEEPAQVVDWQRDALLLQHVQLRDVLIRQKVTKQPGVENSQLEEMGYDLLVHGSTGPLLLRKREGETLRYWMLFHSDQSTLPYRVGFPVLISNLVNEALQASELGEARARETGVLPPLQASPDSQCVITGPAGDRETRRADERGRLSGILAPRTGEYRIESEGERLAVVGASLLNATETSLAAVDKIQFDEISVASTEEVTSTDRPWWDRMALLALGVLLLEWWAFQKKPSGAPD